MDLTVKVHEVMLPPTTEQERLEGGSQRELLPSGNVTVSRSVTAVSDPLHPEPFTITDVPVGPRLGENDSIGLFTVKGTDIDPCWIYDGPEGPPMVTVCTP
jgi:hypothetical protein